MFSRFVLEERTVIGRTANAALPTPIKCEERHFSLALNKMAVMVQQGVLKIKLGRRLRLKHDRKQGDGKK